MLMATWRIPLGIQPELHDVVVAADPDVEGDVAVLE